MNTNKENKSQLLNQLSRNVPGKIFHLLLLLCVLTMLGCDGGGAEGEVAAAESEVSSDPMSLNQAAYVRLSASYQFGYNSIPSLKITGAPESTDWNRWAMLHDGSTYRLYFFKYGTNDTLYQFAYNPKTTSYEYGYNSIPTLTITNIPGDADASSFAMLHDGSAYRLYMRSKSRTAVYQYAFNRSTGNYEYGHNSIPRIDVTGAPADTDFDRWGMLHDGSTYRFYAFKGTLDGTFYQFAFNRSTSDYEYGYNSIDVLSLDLIPENSDTSSFAMLHDGRDYRFYFLTI